MEKQTSLEKATKNRKEPTDIKGIFSQYIEKKTIFKDKSVLSSSFVPSTIPHREEQIKQLAAILAPALRNHQPSNIFIYGPVGTGKSISAKYVIDELNKVAKENNGNLKTICINCKMKKTADTEYRLFAQLLKELGHDVPDTGLPTDVLYRKFFEMVVAKPQTVILVLDEIDALIKKVGDEFLYNLTRINTEMTKSKISLIGITNDLSFTEALDARVKSSLGEEEMIFPPYNALQLRDILLQRANLGFIENAVDEAVINKCAALAAQEHGDARRAIDLLRVAGEIAERINENRVTEKHVDMAEEKIDLDRVTETVKNQPKQSQAVLYAVLKLNEGNNLTGDMFSMYEKICRNNNMKVLTQRRVSDLVNELDMFGIITSRVVSKGRYGRSREITLAISDAVLKRVEKILEERFGAVS